MEGGSVSAIRQFMFGQDTYNDGWKFSSLARQKRKSPSDIKSPSFRTGQEKKSFFQTWVFYKTPSRYASTPDLKSEGLGVSFAKAFSNVTGRPSVKRMVRDIENTVAKLERSDSVLKLETSPIENGVKASWNNEVPSASESLPKSTADNGTAADVSSSEISQTLLDRSNAIKDPSSNETNLSEVQHFSNAYGVSNPLYLEVQPEVTSTSSKEVETQGSDRSNSSQSPSESFLTSYVTNGNGNFSGSDDSGCDKDYKQDDHTETHHSTSDNSNQNHKPLVVIQEPGRFLARWVPVDNLSTRDATTEPSGVKESKPRRPAERRESGRLQSAARILRSLGRNRDEEVRGREREGAGLKRSNPHYHSEGKGSNKVSVEKSSTVVGHKERSKSFCDKPEVKSSSIHQQEEQNLRKEAKSRLERKGKSSSHLHLDVSSSSASPKDTSSACDPSSPVTNLCFNSSSPVFVSRRPSPIGENCSENASATSETEPAHLQEVDCALNLKTLDTDHTFQGSEFCSAEEKRDHKTCRKLTKDSGYETCPYSEADCANLNSSASELYSKCKGGVNEAQNINETAATTPECEQSVAERSTCHQNIFEPGSPNDDVQLVDGVDQLSNITRNLPEKSQEAEEHQQRCPSAESLATFADSLLVGVPASSPASSLPPARSTPALCHNDHSSTTLFPDTEAEEVRHVNGTLQASKSTPNLEEAEDDMMVTKKFPMHSYPEGSSPSSRKGSHISSTPRDTYWDVPLIPDGSFNSPVSYAHHLRSSSFQMIHSRQHSTSHHSRQSSNASNYSDGDDTLTSLTYNYNLDRSRCFSFDSLGDESSEASPSFGVPWNISEPDLNIAAAYAPASFPQKYDRGQLSPSSNSKKSLKNVSEANKLPSSPPPPPVRDASSLKYIRYGPGHEKFPSWPVPAAAATQMVPPPHPMNVTLAGIPDVVPFMQLPQGSHRSHSWTEQSEYPKEKCGGYARPYLKKQFSPSFQKQLLTVMEKCEKIPPEVFHSCPPEELMRNPYYPFSDSYMQHSTYYPLFDRDGRPIDDKDYSIPSPPERDPGMGEAHLSQVTMAQLEEHARRCDLAYGDRTTGEFPQITPLLDQLRQESYTWDGASERDSGRGESEGFTDSRYSNGRDSVTTVVTNSSSASSSETLKWHGSLSDISVLSVNSRDARGDHNIVHSARVQAPQRHNSESVLYYGRGKPHSVQKILDGRVGREGVTRNIRDLEGISGYSRNYKDALWNREVERNNEVNNLKKFPSYSYTQPLSQITEAPLAETGDVVTLSKSPTVDLRKPPSVAERIHELERQSRSISHGPITRWQRDHSEPRDVRRYREDGRDGALDFRKISSERTIRTDDEGSESNCHERLSPNSVTRCRTSRASSCSRRKSEETIRSSDALLRSPSDCNTTYTYLDPDKKCKVSDTTLKSIQKQALLSFYERRTGKCLSRGGTTSRGASASPKILPGGEFPIHQWDRNSLRGERAGKGMAKLGRVPDSDNEGSSLPPTPVRTHSISGEREKKDDLVNVDESAHTLLGQTEHPPGLPAKSHHSTNKASTISLSQTHSSPGEENDEKDETKQSQELDRRSSPSRLCKDNLPSPQRESSGSAKASSLPQGSACSSLTPLTSDALPKPPERPPKKPNLRSLFHAPQNSPPEKEEPTESECKESSSTSRPYFYRKPPAPDPPTTSPSSSSRSPTPELPPPPPPPVVEETEVVASDEPLPPPPPPPPPPVEDVPPQHFSPKRSPSKKRLPLSSTAGTYHKDSYMAHRKDWTTGYEGRYRRTHSPTALERNFINGREHFHSNNHNINCITNATNGIKHMKTSNIVTTATTTTSLTSNKPPFLYRNSGNLRSAISTSSLLKRPSSPVSNDVALNNADSDNEFFCRNLNNKNNFSNCNSNRKNNNNNNEWTTPHPRQLSTTVDFTAEELKAFKARQAANETQSKQYSLDFKSCDSLPYTSPTRPLMRAVSVGEPLHYAENSFQESIELANHDSSYISRLSNETETPLHSSSSTLTSLSTISRSSSSTETLSASERPLLSSPSASSKTCIPSASPVSHDGPITAHPATVTEDDHSIPGSPIAASSSDLSSPSSLSDSSLHRATSVADTYTSPQSSPKLTSSSNFSLCPQPVRSPSSSSPSKIGSLFEAATSESPSSLVTPSSLVICSDSLSSTTESFTSFMTTVTPAIKSTPAYHRSLSATGTCPSMTSADLPPEEQANRKNIVVLSYGRTLNPEEINCNKLSAEFAERNNIDNKLQNLLAPSLDYKSTASYMEGVFTLELRRDLLCQSHANHPDLKEDTGKSLQDDSGVSNNNNTRSTNERTLLSSDSSCFTTPEGTMTTFSKLRKSPASVTTEEMNEESQLLERKKELIRSIDRKLDILRAEQLAIKEEIAANLDLGRLVTARVESRAKTSEAEKYKLHVEEIDKITSLLLVLSGRLAKAENSLSSVDIGPEEKKNLKEKREKLKEQLSEAKMLKENIDRRAVQVSRTVSQYLSEDEYADYDHFSKMKAKLLMDAKEIDDKVKLGEEQLEALRRSVPNL